MDTEVLTKKMEDAFSRLSKADDASHDIHHARRVKSLALAIAEREAAGNPTHLIAAAYLHDIVNLPKNSPDRAKASFLSADAAAPILREIGFDETEVKAVCHAIIAHSFSANVSPETIDARILQDADRIDSLGAIGIARTFFIAGRLGTNLFDGDDPFASQRPLDDRKFAIDHFAVKLLRLPETMQTRSGREVAQERTAIMRDFLSAFGDELGRSSTW